MGIQGPQQPIQPRGEKQRGGALQPMTINEIMESDVVTCETDTPIATVVSKMAEEDVGMVVVVDGESPVDVITDRAIALALQDNPDIADSTAEDFQTEGLVTGSTDMTVVEALEKMRGENIRRLPIVDDEGNLEGVLSLDDVLIVFGQGLGGVADLIADQVKR